MTFNLVEGTNIRDWVNDGYNSAIAGGTPSATFDNGATRFDMQTFVLPSAFASATLTDIILTNVGGNPQGIPFLTAATVATTSGTPQLVLLGGGTAPDVTNSATITVTAVGSLRGQVSLGLDAGSDSGTKGDGRTNVAAPTFDVTVNQAGTITVDYKGNGSSTATRAVAAAGTYQFTAPGLADGTYTTTAKFTPSGGTAVSASLTFTVDTQAPTLRAGAAAQGPLFTRTLTFSENMDASTISAASILVSGPGITGTINPAQVIGGGATYTVSFSNPLTKGGFYTLQLASTIADLAGNPSGSGVTDSFQLIPDTTPPVVSSVTPAGIVASAVTSIGVAFNKAIAAASFTSGQVTITGPGGTLPTASLTVTATDPQDFTVSFPAIPERGLCHHPGHRHHRPFRQCSR